MFLSLSTVTTIYTIKTVCPYHLKVTYKLNDTVLKRNYI